MAKLYDNNFQFEVRKSCRYAHWQTGWQEGCDRQNLRGRNQGNSIISGEKVRPRFGGRSLEIPPQGHQENGKEKNHETHHCEALRQVREPEPHDAHQIHDQRRNRLQEHRYR